MDCRNWLLLAAAVILGGTGCITQQQNGLTDKTSTTVWTPLSIFQKETKRAPKIETCLQGGQMLEQQALGNGIDVTQKEKLLERARKAYQQALDQEPNNAQALLGIAKVYEDWGQYDKAGTSYDKAVKAHPKNVQVWAELGRCQFEQKHYDQAADALKKAVECDPNERNCAKMLSLSLALAGREQESLQVLTTLYGEAQAHYKYALLLKHLNQPEKARLQLTLALQHDPMLRPAEQLLSQMQPAPAITANAPAPIVNISFRPD